MKESDTLYGCVLYDSGFRYVIDNEDDMMRIGYREDGEDNSFNHEKDILIGWDHAIHLGNAILKIAELNRVRP